MERDLSLTIGILADDLTSAADGAGPFVETGRRATVGRGRSPRTGSVRAVDSGTRSVSAAEAAERAATLTAELASCDILYKTCDSTLRGHVGIEIEASYRASGRSRLVFAPAFPDAGRTTVAGIQLVDGVPVSESVYGCDPVHPARHSVLADLVPSSISDVVVINAETQDALNERIAALPEPRSILWVGSPGMAVALAKRFAPRSEPAFAPDDPRGEVLIVVGSANPVSHRQVAALEGIAGVSVLQAPQRREDDPAAVLRRIADEAATLIRHGRFTGVIATGGDTMEAVLDRLNVAEFEVVRELEPGFPLGRANLDNGRRLSIAMKAGGFGDDGTLRRAAAKLNSSRRATEPLNP